MKIPIFFKIPIKITRHRFFKLIIAVSERALKMQKLTLFQEANGFFP